MPLTFIFYLKHPDIMKLMNIWEETNDWFWWQYEPMKVTVEASAGWSQHLSGNLTLHRYWESRPRIDNQLVAFALQAVWGPNELTQWSLVRLWSTVVQVITCCLISSSHYMTHGWAVIMKSFYIHLIVLSVKWARYPSGNMFENYTFKIVPHHPGHSELKTHYCFILHW